MMKLSRLRLIGANGGLEEESSQGITADWEWRCERLERDLVGEVEGLVSGEPKLREATWGTKSSGEVPQPRHRIRDPEGPAENRACIGNVLDSEGRCPGQNDGMRLGVREVGRASCRERV